MPTYTYECTKCGRFTMKSSIAARDKERLCPQCKEHKLRRVLDAPKSIEIEGIEATASQAKWHDSSSV